jgi:glycosyltransferase involved in cell wall biosynthesis
MAHVRHPRIILVSANSLWNIHNFRRRLLERLADAGFAVAVAAPREDAASEMPTRWQAQHSLTINSDGLNPIRDGLLVLAYLRLLRRTRPLAYLSFTAKPNIYGALAAGLMSIPALPNVSGLGTAFINGGALQRLISLMYRAAFRRAPIVFFQNGEDRDLFIRRKLVRPGQARLLPGSGVDLKFFRPPTEPGGDGAGCTFLFVGRILGDKGVRELAEAARLVKAVEPQARFQLLGFVGAANRSAIGRQELADWQRDGLLEYLGAADDVRPFLAAADAVVLPSYREGLPRSLLEAAAMARPLIATDVPGNREVVVEGRNGLLCAVRSGASLAEALLRFMRLPAEEKQRMGEASRQLVEERFSEEKVVTAYLDAIHEVAGREMIQADRAAG